MDASYSRDCHSDSILHTKISGHIMESEKEMKRGQVFNDDFKQGKTEDSDFLVDVLLLTRRTTASGLETRSISVI